MGGRDVHISVNTGTIIRVIVALFIAWFLFTIRDIVLIVLTAVVIASAVEPGVVALMKRKIPRTLSVVAVYLGLFAGFFVIFYFFVPSVVVDFATFMNALPGYLGSLGQSGMFDQYAQLFGVSSVPAISSADILASIRSVLNMGDAFGSALGAATRIFGGIFSTMLIIVLSIYFAVIETGVDDFLRIVTPRQHQGYVLGLWRRSQHKIGLWMQGQLLLAAIIGILVYLGLTILGVPHALVLAVIAAAFEIIPVFGPVLSAVPGIAVAFVFGGATLGMLTVALYVIAQQFENHLIYPLVVSRVVGVPPLLVILALIIGGQLAGFLGIILSVPAAAILQEFAHDIETGRFERHEEAVAEQS